MPFHAGYPVPLLATAARRRVVFAAAAEPRRIGTVGNAFVSALRLEGQQECRGLPRLIPPTIRSMWA